MRFNKFSFPPSCPSKYSSRLGNANVIFADSQNGLCREFESFNSLEGAYPDLVEINAICLVGVFK